MGYEMLWLTKLTKVLERESLNHLHVSVDLQQIYMYNFIGLGMNSPGERSWVCKTTVMFLQRSVYFHRA